MPSETLGFIVSMENCFKFYIMKLSMFISNIFILCFICITYN